MIRIACFATLLLVLACTVAASGEQIKLNPGSMPLRTKTLEKPRVVEAVFPITPTDRKSFTASAKIDVETWNHYASIRATFRSSKYEHRFGVALAKADDGLKGIAMDLLVTSGIGYKSTLCYLPPDAKSFTVTLKYIAPLSRFKMIVAQDHRVLGESDWIKMRGHFSVDEFVVEAGSGKNGLEPAAAISWDSGDAALRAVSHVGDEGGYKYLMVARIKEAAIQME
jgi:hypothetical protein